MEDNVKTVKYNGRTHTYESAMRRLIKVAKQSETAANAWYVDFTLCGNKTRGILDYLAGQHGLLFIDKALMPTRRN